MTPPRHFQSVLAFAEPQPFKLARRTDPATSKEAAVKASKSESHRQAVWWAVRDHPNCTYRELACHVEFEAVEVMRRLNDLRLSGRVVQGDIRKCRINGSRMVTWRIV